MRMSSNWPVRKLDKPSVRSPGKQSDVRKRRHDAPRTFEDMGVPSNEGQLAQWMSRGARTFEDMGVLSTRDEGAPGRRLVGKRSMRTSGLSNPPKYSLPARIHERLGIASD